MAHFHLGTASFVTSPARDRLAALRAKYAEVGLESQEDFFSNYSSIKTVDELFQRYPDELDAVLEETVSMVASDLAAERVYDMDITAIRAELMERVGAIRADFDRVQERYFHILGKAAELDAQRKDATKNRGSIVGGGFGVEGAAQGIAVAAVANAAIGLTARRQLSWPAERQL